MKAFMFSQYCPFILQLIQEILDFKSWVNGYLNASPNVFDGHTKMHLFRFFVGEVGWPMMQYKVSPTDALWSPKGGPTIRLWKEDGTGRAKLLAKVPNLVPFCPIWGNDEQGVGEEERFIGNKISKYIEFWKLGMSKDNSNSNFGTVIKTYPMIEFCSVGRLLAF